MRAVEGEPSPLYRALREIAEDERPRERLLKHGADTLSDSELVAILLGTGRKGENVVDLARSMLDAFGGLPNMVRSDVRALQKRPGLGPAKATQLAAAFELGRRAHALDVRDRPDMSAPESVFALLGGRLAYRPKEEFHVLAVDGRARLLGSASIMTGTINHLTVRPAEVFREAIMNDASGIIVVHNHPSGDPRPSPEDIQTTRTIRAAGKLLDVDVLDHVIIGQGRFFSMKREGLGFEKA